MTRKGKIARLPRDIRDQLNTRLDDGDQGTDLVQWLNTLDDVKETLETHFHGRPITEQNLSEWKQGGFLDWRRQQQTSERVRALVQLSDDIADATDDQSIPDRLARVLAAELAVQIQQLLAETTDPKERWKYLCEALRQLAALRQGDDTALIAKLKNERWKLECEQRERKEKEQALSEAHDYVTAPIWDALQRETFASVFGGGESGEKVADFLTEMNQKYRDVRWSKIHHHLPDWPSSQSNEFKPDPTKSDQIRPNPTKSDQTKPTELGSLQQISDIEPILPHS